MVEGLIGQKVGMTQVFNDDGSVTPATILRAGPCVVVQRKTTERDGYSAAQIAYVETKPVRHVTKPVAGHYKKHANIPPARMLREFPIGDADQTNPGDSVLVTIFSKDEKVDVIGISKGRGFAGVVRRHHFHGGAASHGSMFHRAPGSIGSSAYPSRVLKGMKAAGHLGNSRVTVRHLKVLHVDPDAHMLVVKGAVPGRNGGYLIIRRTGK
ncbi:MAG: 50S ribosomal protein L3 [Acidobacteriota bacterium]